MSGTANDDTWHHWSYTTTSTDSGTTTWATWIDGATSTTSTTAYTTDTVWAIWSDNTTYRVVQVVPPALSDEERAAREAAQIDARRQAEEHERQRKAANAKATELLRANLSQKQREALDKNGWFVVEGGKSKKLYRVHGTGRMEEMEGDAAVASFCVHADYTIPMPDQVLAKALCIALDEEYILRTANRTPLRVAA